MWNFFFFFFDDLLKLICEGVWKNSQPNQETDLYRLRDYQTKIPLTDLIAFEKMLPMGSDNGWLTFRAANR